MSRLKSHDQDSDSGISLQSLGNRERNGSGNAHNNDLFPPRFQKSNHISRNSTVPGGLTQASSEDTSNAVTSETSSEDPADYDQVSLNSVSTPVDLISNVSVGSSTIREVLLTVPDKAKLYEEIKGFKDRKFFTDLFRLSNNNVIPNGEDDFTRYNRELKVENYLRTRTRDYLLTHQADIDIIRRDLNEDDQYVAGKEAYERNVGFKFLNRRFNGIRLNRGVIDGNHRSDDTDLRNYKSLETNIIDNDVNHLYNVPIDHQHYNNLVNTHQLRFDNGGNKASGVMVNDYENVEMLNSMESLEDLDHADGYVVVGEDDDTIGAREWRRRNYEIQRKLSTRHMTMIAFGGTLGVGLFLASGKAFSIAGPLGTLLGFMIAGSTVLATMLSFCEMVTLIPLAGGVSGISSRFVEDAFGFALGISYWLNYMLGLPTEITAATIMLSYYDTLKIPGPSTAGFVTLFLVVIIGINLCDIRVYGEIEYISSLIKLLLLLTLIIFNVVLNLGGVAPYHQHIGFKYWDSSKSNLAEKITYGPFRPTFDVNDTGLGALDGIGGSKGRFLAVLIAAVIAAYCFIGTEIALIAGGEARNPRKAIPKSSKAIYWRILLFYIVGIFVISLNIYSGDPRLLRYYSSGVEDGSATEDKLREAIIEANGGTTCDSTLFEWAGFANGNQSPWVIALQSAGLCGFSSALNAFLVYFALTAGSSQLYVASRTCYYMSIQGKLPKFFATCSRHGVPYVSVLVTGAVGSLAYLTVNNDTATVFAKFLSVCSSFGLVVWGGMNLSFIRFYYGLKLRPDIISRDDESYPYKSPLQPYLAYYGLISSVILVFVNGIVVFLKGNWSVSSFFSSYGSVFVMVICYLGYKILRHSKIHRVDQLDLDSGRREIDRIVWEDSRTYNHSFKEMLKKSFNFMA